MTSLLVTLLCAALALYVRRLRRERARYRAAGLGLLADNSGLRHLLNLQAKMLGFRDGLIDHQAENIDELHRTLAEIEPVLQVARRILKTAVSGAVLPDLKNLADKERKS